MTRFRAYASDSSSSSSEDEEEIKKVQSRRVDDDSESEESEEDVDEEDEESSDGSMSSSEMLEHELVYGKSRRRRRTALVEDENGDMQLEGDDDEDERSSSGSSSHSESLGPRGVPGDPNIIPWARQIGVDAQKMHVMQASLFSGPGEAAALKAINDAKPRHKALALQPSLNRKHSRDSDGDGIRNESRERASFDDTIDQEVFRPSRKYARVAVTSSIAQGKEGEFLDAGLALGRSFRSGWGPGGALVHLGSIGGLSSPSSSTSPSAVSFTPTPFPAAKSASPETSPPAIAAKLLQHHLTNTPITKDANGYPYANVKPHTERLNFASFASIFPTTDAVDPAPLFRLGSALFDPIDLRLNAKSQGVSSLPGAALITPDVRNKILSLRRRAALGKWLETVVGPTVEGDIRTRATSVPGSKYTHADTIYTQLTGHQISSACTTAMDAGYLKLATLVSQAGGDDVFKVDIQTQIDIWRKENLAPSKNPSVGTPSSTLMNRGVWRVYQLLGGLPFDEQDQDNWVDEVCAGLDWKRILGICLWYGTGIDTSVTEVVGLYEALLMRYTPAQIARPTPKWQQEQKSGPLSSSTALSRYDPVALRSPAPSLPTSQKPQAEDPLYSLIRLHADPALSLCKALDPLSHGPDERWGGIGMCWHLYMIISRNMRIRDFADRQALKKALNGIDDRETSAEDDVDFTPGEGSSHTANLLTSSYAFELESWGMVQEAAFVLLHLEQAQGREKALKDLLARSAPKMDDWMTRGLVGSLKIPITWVNEAKAMYALDQGDVFNAYELYLSAQLYNSAHDLAVLELAPDAVLRRDLELIQDLFEPFDLDGRRDKVDGWFVRGKVFIDYVKILTRVPALHEQMEAERRERGGGTIIPDAAQADELDDLIRKVPKVIALLPDVLHRGRNTDDRHAAAIEEMTQRLLAVVGKARPSTLLEQPVLRFMAGATKINLIRGKGYARFLQNVSA